MKISRAVIAAALATIATVPALAATEGSNSQAQRSAQMAPGQMLHSSSGRPIAAVYDLSSSGNPRVIIDGRMVAIPAETLSIEGGKLKTTLSVPTLRRMSHSR